ncbi:MULTISPECIES: LysE family translocator [unclassified Rhodococcus (in: high G+C Gram-positive bacteria)]|uniref:LysE family translocator n=1 Tax=unclassified Rhodococcus (in: high G+C Gram-positive bacteria) TaxID=192944 RepID=UPI0006FB5525|nr:MULTISPECIES: LysE family translocator [unclassified Rhodococcus (in: high G+C Gram-positive bacteria)]KQU29395.1 hypothetical protein ASG69_06890 [Rhodococcus sp. Leaf225]KQU41142.1 hypothetical protein ASH03_19465 [Rhodococcus sp. Leaf258]
MPIETVLAFCGVAFLAYITPGPDWFVVMPAAVTSRRTGWIAAIGVQCGLLVHMSAAAVGVAAVILASATAFSVLKWIGAAYLVYLGVRALLASRRQSSHPVEGADDTDHPVRTAGLRVWRRAFTANVLNPKAALFFVAILPQFVTPGGAVAVQIIGLGLLDVALGVVWWAVFVLGVHRLRSIMGGTRARTVTDRVAGTALIGLGGVLAVTPSRV